MSQALPFNPALGACSRLPSLAARTRSARALELGVLLGAGAMAVALALFVKQRFGIPGHHLILIMPPLALGLALVPRRHGGSVMSLGGLGAVLAASFFGGSLGVGALTSTLLAGPALDFACTRRDDLRSPLLAFALAGLAANLMAFGVRFGCKLGGLGGLGKPLGAWLPKALICYPAAGVIAGLLGAWLFFRMRRPGAEEPSR